MYPLRGGTKGKVLVVILRQFSWMFSLPDMKRFKQFIVVHKKFKKSQLYGKIQNFCTNKCFVWTWQTAYNPYYAHFFSKWKYWNLLFSFITENQNDNNRKLKPKWWRENLYTCRGTRPLQTHLRAPGENLSVSKVANAPFFVILKKSSSVWRSVH